MTETAKQPKGIWAYLEERGVLEHGTEEQIKRAKQEYKKIYILSYKRKQRQTNPEYIISFSSEKGEYKKVADASKEHKTSITQFIKQATLAYMDKTYIVPDKEKVAELEQILSQCRNDIKTISKNKIQSVQDQIQAIDKRIAEMEESIDSLFRHPTEVITAQNHDR